MKQSTKEVFDWALSSAVKKYVDKSGLSYGHVSTETGHDRHWLKRRLSRQAGFSMWELHNILFICGEVEVKDAIRKLFYIKKPQTHYKDGSRPIRYVMGKVLGGYRIKALCANAGVNYTQAIRFMGGWRDIPAYNISLLLSQARPPKSKTLAPDIGNFLDDWIFSSCEKPVWQTDAFLGMTEYRVYLEDTA